MNPLRAQLGKAVTSRTLSGIPRTASDGPTAWRDTTGWRLVLDHLLQPAEGSAGELGKPQYTALLPDGRLFVVDASPASIRLYDGTGKYLRAIGRQGAGPGEFRSPFIGVGARWLVVQDPELVRATVFSLDGRLIRSFQSVCCNFGPTPFVDGAGRISAASFSMSNGVGSRAWIVFDSMGHRVDSVPYPKLMDPKVWTTRFGAAGGGNASATYTIPFAAENQNVRLPDGGFVHGRTDRYEFVVSRDGRDTLRLFGRSGVTPVPIPAGYRDSVYHARVDKNDRLRAIASEADVPVAFPLWTQIDRDGSGNVWVTRGGTLSGPAVLDVFAPTGAFLGTVPRPWDAGDHTSWAGDRVAVLDTDANDLPRVRVFRIERRR